MRNNQEQFLEISYLNKKIEELECAVKDLKRHEEVLIAEKKRTEEALEEGEAHFHGYFKLLPVGVAIISPDKVWIETNDALCEMLGYSRQELAVRTWPELIHPDDLADDIGRFDRVLAGHADRYSMDKRLIRKGGETIWTSFSMRCVRRSNGDPDYLIALFQDVTGRKNMEEELKTNRDHLRELVTERTEQIRQEVTRRERKEEQYLAFVESIEEWMWETDANFVFTYVSPRIYDVLGYEPGGLVGKSHDEIMPAEEAKRVIALMNKISSRKNKSVFFEAVFFHKDGHTVFIDANGRPFFDSKGNILGYRGSCRDVTERKKSMDALKERELDLLIKSKTLSEVNAALGVLLKQRGKDRKELEDIFISNIREMVLPYIMKLQKERPNPRHKIYLDIVTTNLNEIISPFLNTIRQLNFTPKEIEVSSFIKEGKTTKEIADLMSVAPSAIDSHRNNIRKKLGLNNKKVNLRSHLLSLK